MKNSIKIIIRTLLILILLIFGSKLIWLTIGYVTKHLAKLSMFYYNVALKENLFIIGKSTFEFIPACNANLAYLLLALLILLTKNINFKKGIKLFVIGSLLILIANVLRMNILVIAEIEFGSEAYETLHMFFWKVLSTIYVAFVWIFLVYKYRIKEIPIYSYLKDIYKKSYFKKK